jgi:hypothetical protein
LPIILALRHQVLVGCEKDWQIKSHLTQVKLQAKIQA